MYKGRRLGSIPSKDDILGFAERIEFMFDVHVDVACVGMLDMVMSLDWVASYGKKNRALFHQTHSLHCCSYVDI